ncbi:2-dehydro-3-deoxygalactonokinase [Methylobacterium platani]|uniref:2-keto-3-deoxy-galactonokinase n=2 Tax=Methylobacterium platani TaxID=427683 RepID=A0A179RUD6_9HYPH|nr:2-dehydro-3-deoxygalactonokinase [Methylobacterium platani]KMO13577.1 2-keto-3-deoxy-galactonokinase [Methylobacterium platani JCM 14648]OAS12361.1 2-keto-3-deoxy-galactonokinase [Methylobacterium platani]
MIAVDWGTSSARAYRLAPDGRLLERRESAGGILRVPEGGFPAALAGMVGDWLAAGETRVLLSGMVGSRQGWQEAPYLACPAGVDDLARAVVPVPFDGATVRLVPGLSTEDAGGTPEVMRGEEVQIFGALDFGALAGDGRDALLCLPGSHAKWVRVAGGRIAGFSTHMTGEAFAALKDHTILGRMMTGTAEPGPAFEAGIARSAEAGGLLHHLFGTRTLGLFGRLAPEDAASYLSGLLIGHEVASAMTGPAPVYLVGSGPLMALYGRAIALKGGEAIAGDPDIAARGLGLIGERTEWA